MAKEYDMAPEEPKWSRRARSDWIELLNMALFVTSLYFLISNYEDQDIQIVYKKLDFVLTFIFGIFVVLFDISAMKRQRKKHQFDLEQYELLRKTWLDLRKKTIEDGYSSAVSLKVASTEAQSGDNEV
jgi:hypothetical protein